MRNLENLDSPVSGSINVEILGVGRTVMSDLKGVPAKRIIAVAGAKITGQPFSFSPEGEWNAGYREPDDTIVVWKK